MGAFLFLLRFEYVCTTHAFGHCVIFWGNMVTAPASPKMPVCLWFKTRRTEAKKVSNSSHALCRITWKLHVYDVSAQIKTGKLAMLYVLEFMLKHFVVKILITDSSGSMNDSKWPAVSLSVLSMFENALTMFWNDFEMDLQRISVLLRKIANVSKCNGNVLQCIFNTLKMQCNTTTLFSLSLLFPKRVTFLKPFVPPSSSTISFLFLYKHICTFPCLSLGVRSFQFSFQNS